MVLSRKSRIRFDFPPLLILIWDKSRRSLMFFDSFSFTVEALYSYLVSVIRVSYVDADFQLTFMTKDDYFFFLLNRGFDCCDFLFSFDFLLRVRVDRAGVSVQPVHLKALTFLLPANLIALANNSL